ncbi:unnamed protein product, partial [Coregonus sp. 'balchen']
QRGRLACGGAHTLIGVCLRTSRASVFLSYQTDDSEDECPEPRWKSQKDMVRKLQTKFPELRGPLLEHGWHFEETLEALHMFSEEGERSSQEDTQASSSATCQAAPAAKPPGQSPSLPYKPTNGTIIKTVNRLTEGADKRRRVIPEPGTSSEDEASDDFDESAEGMELNLEEAQIWRLEQGMFFQEASPDELSLISGCSVKKAQRIVALRPFNKWEDLVTVLDGGNGLSTDLVQGCCVVLWKQDVVRSLLTKCENITNKMRQDVTQVVERDKGSQKQPEILISKFQLELYQLIGQNCLTLLHQNNLSGILADEMVSWSVEDRRFLQYDILNKRVDYNIIISTLLVGTLCGSLSCCVSASYALTIGNDNDRSLFRKLKLEYAEHELKNMSSLR